MKFNGSEIRILRQRLGWSFAEMARRMSCSTDLIKKWENEGCSPDPDAINQLHYLQSFVEANSEIIAKKPMAEKEMRERRVGQLTNRDLLKDIQ